MKNAEKEHTTQLEREKAVFLYSAALERGDFETVTLMLEKAQQDAVLEQMILEVNEVFGFEHDRILSEEIALSAEAAQVKQILYDAMPSSMHNAEEEAAELPPLTVLSVLAQMQEDSTLNPQIRQEAARVQKTLRQEADVPLPADLSQRNVRRLLGEIGVSVGEHLQKMFRQAAIFLAMGREQGLAQLAATRRQNERLPVDRKEQGEK